MLLLIYYVIYRKRCLHESQMLALRLSFVRSSRWQIFFKIDVIKKFVNFAGKHLRWSLFLIKIKTDSNTDVFPWNKNIFFTEHLRWPILEGFYQGTSLVKSCSSVILLYLESITDASKRCPLRKLMNNCDCWNIYRFSCYFQKC